MQIGFDDLQPALLAEISALLAISAVMSGLSGFGFSAIGASCLWFLPAQEGIPLLMALSLVNQLMSIGQLRADLQPLRLWWSDGPAPYLVGGIIGVPFGLGILRALPAPELILIFGLFLSVYAVYSLSKKQPPPAVTRPSPWWVSMLVGTAGGIIGGFTAFPGAIVVVWGGRRNFGKTQARGIVQPYILGLQLISLVILGSTFPQTFSLAFWTLFAAMLFVVLPGTLIGVHFYRSLSDVSFRRVGLLLLGISGFGLLLKGINALILL